jgi:hypothetical protein
VSGGHGDRVSNPAAFWILETIGPTEGQLIGDRRAPWTEAQLIGNTRVRWSGDAAHGRMEVSCPASRSRSGPLNVVGVEEGITCDAEQMQTASCAVDADLAPGPIRPVLSGVKTTTVMEDGTAIVQTHKARVNKVRLHSTFPSRGSVT